MTYNELAQVLEQKNPDTGELYKLDDLNVIKMSDLGTGALEDGVFVTRGLDRGRGEPGHREAVPQGELPAAGSSAATTRTSACQHVLDNGPTLGEGHQRWMLNEINELIWPTPQGIGVMDPESSTDHGRHREGLQDHRDAGHGDGAYRTDLAEAADRRS